ncbi:hypothetical protein [Paenibacillus sp. GCM10012303]|uniref:hypothetical protein n=1 Tax=Paenibacillus sp. GCM10012303 TaxID=3317340 RepID=UPI00360E5D8F
MCRSEVALRPPEKRRLMRSGLTALLFIAVSVITAGSVQLHAVRPAAAAKITIVSVPGWSFLDWEEDMLARMPNLQSMIRQGAIGAMNVRNPEKGLEDSYTALGSGAPASSSPDYGAFHVRERIGGLLGEGSAPDVYRKQTGLETNRAEIVVPDIAAIRRRNETRGHRAQAGLLGDYLRGRGLITAVYGNSDSAGTRRRFAPLMLMDSQGLVTRGDTGETMLLPDFARPSFVRTNLTALLEAWETVEARSVVLLEWGDLYRLQTEVSRYGEDQAKRMKAELLGELDHLLGGLMERRQQGDLLWILSPFVGAEAARHKMLLAPAVLIGDAVPAGLLTSPSTRREGIITASDIAPSLLASYGIGTPDDMIGREVTIVRKGGAWSELHRELNGIREVYRTRPQVLIPFVTAEAVVLVAALIALWLKLGSKARWMEALLLFLLAAPLTLLWIGWLNAVYPVPGNVQIVLFLTFTTAGAYLFRFGRSALSAAGLVSAVTALLLLLDGVLGGEGMKRSVLGYDPMIGARYYGMGNEYMGVLVGAVTFAFAAMMERWRSAATSGASAAQAAAATAASAPPGSPAPPALDAADAAAAAATPRPRSRRSASAASRARLAAPRPPAPAAAPPPPSRVSAAAKRRRATRLAAALSAAPFAAVAAYLAAPQLGANAGGAITAAVAFGLAWLRCFAGGFARGLGLLRLALLCAALVAAAVAGLWLLNAALPSGSAGQSHIGRAMAMLGQGRTDLIAATIVRKLQMNLHLIGVSAWTKVLAAGMLVMAIAVARPQGVFRRWESRYPDYMTGFLAIAVGSVAALAFNDSGIVAAATMIVYAAVPMLLLRFQEDSSSHSA